MIAVITMLIDHTAYVLFTHMPQTMQELYSGGPSLYRLCRDIGRVAFPIYCFLLIEGFLHTHDRFKYGRNLLFFALLSEIPWNFMNGYSIRCDRQNVFFTLFLGYLAFCCIEAFRERPWLQLILVLLLLFVSYHLNADYGWRGFVFLLIMYGFRYQKVEQAVTGSCWLYYEWKACFAFLSINMYNGERGFIKGKWKYAFYFFYPVHITVLVLIRYFVFHV
jgi:hypothetical protein